MEESTCHEMVIHLSQRFSGMLCLFIYLNLFISFKRDFHVYAERNTVKTRQMVRNISVDGLKKNNVWHDTSSVGKNCQVFVGCGQLNY